MNKNKTFFVISALLQDSSRLGNLKRLDTEKQAIEHAKSVIERRRQEGSPEITFHVLKVVAIVEAARAPIKVTKVK